MSESDVKNTTDAAVSTEGAPGAGGGVRDADESAEALWNETGDADGADEKPDAAAGDEKADGEAESETEGDESKADDADAAGEGDEKPDADAKDKADDKDAPDPAKESEASNAYWGTVAAQHPDIENFIRVTADGRAVMRPDLADWFKALPEDVRKRAGDPENPYGVVEMVSRLKADIAAGKVADKPQGEPNAGGKDEAKAIEPLTVDGLLADPALKEVKFKDDDGKETNLADTLKSYGEAGHLMVGLLNIALAKMQARQPGADPSRAVADINARIAEMERDLSDVRLARAHKDAPAVIESPEFKAWLKDIPGSIRAMFERGNASQKADILAAFKREQALKAAAPDKAKNEAELKRRKDLSKGTIRDDGSRDARGGAPAGGKSADPEKAFAEEWEKTGDVKD